MMSRAFQEMRRLSLRPLALAGGAVVLSSLVLAGVAVRALLASGSPAPPPQATAAPAPLPAEHFAVEQPAGEQSAGEKPGAEGPVLERVDPAVMEQAARRAPFDPDRMPPPERYRLPGERVAAAPVLPPLPPQEPPPVPGFELHGVVASVGGGTPFVILSLDGEAPRVLAQGEQMGGYTVAQVVGTSALLTGGGRNYRVSVADPSPSGPAVAQEGGGRGRQPSQAEQRQQQARQQAAQQQVMQQMLQQLQNRLGPNAEIRVEDGRITFRGPDGQTGVIAVPTGAGGTAGGPPATIRFQGGTIIRQPATRGGGGGG